MLQRTEVWHFADRRKVEEELKKIIIENQNKNPEPPLMDEK